MNSHQIHHTRNVSEASDISAHLTECSSSFIPPLDTTVNIKDYSEKLADTSERFEAWNKNELVGLIAIYLNDPNGSTGFITNVSVDPSFQKLGIANKLLVACILGARELNYKQINLEVNPSNQGAINLYQKLGFQTTNSDESKQKMALTLNDK